MTSCSAHSVRLSGPLGQLRTEGARLALLSPGCVCGGSEGGQGPGLGGFQCHTEGSELCP